MSDAELSTLLIPAQIHYAYASYTFIGILRYSEKVVISPSLQFSLCVFALLLYAPHS